MAGTWPEFIPSIDALEASAEGVHVEVGALLNAARVELRLIQDLDAELEDATADTMLAARVARHVARHRLRAISRQFTVAACVLVPVTDRERFSSAQRVITWANEAQRADPPYLDASAA